MDFNKIKLIKSYYNQITKFKQLKKYKNMSKNEFSDEMKLLLPKFYNEYQNIFDLILENKDLKYLNLMFNKLEIIENEFNQRKNEISYIDPIIRELKNVILDNEVSKEDIIYILDNNINNKKFKNEYPLIIQLLVDKNMRKLDIETLLLYEIKFNYEKEIGNILADKYVYPNINR